MSRLADQGNRYQRIRLVLCADCPIRRTCPQFAEQMDACADALMIQAEEEEAPPSLSAYLADSDKEG